MDSIEAGNFRTTKEVMADLRKTFGTTK